MKFVTMFAIILLQNTYTNILNSLKYGQIVSVR